LGLGGENEAKRVRMESEGKDKEKSLGTLKMVEKRRSGGAGI
jgi:hypothetical protein